MMGYDTEEPTGEQPRRPGAPMTDKLPTEAIRRCIRFVDRFEAAAKEAGAVRPGCAASAQAEFAAILKHVEELENIRDRLKQEAAIQAQEMRTQKSTVHEVYQLCTGATGEPGDWNGAEPVRKAFAIRDKRIEEQETQIAVMRARLRRLLDASEHSAKMDWMGDDDPWGDAESALTPDTGKIVEKLPSLARVQEILKDVDGVHFSSQAFLADAIRRIVSLWGYAHELAEMVCALPVTWGQEEVAPDTGKLKEEADDA